MKFKGLYEMYCIANWWQNFIANISSMLSSNPAKKVYNQHFFLLKMKNINLSLCFSHTELEFNVHVDEIMIVFNYIENKDVFESLYRRLLSKRLIHNESTSLDYEEVIISKFKVGFSFVEFALFLSKFFGLANLWLRVYIENGKNVTGYSY